MCQIRQPAQPSEGGKVANSGWDEAWRAGDWAHGRFRLPPSEDTKFIPTPEH